MGNLVVMASFASNPMIILPSGLRVEDFGFTSTPFRIEVLKREAVVSG